MRYAVIKEGQVLNVIVADETFAGEIGALACPADCEPGWLFDGQTWQAPDRTAELAAAVRQRRDELLAQSDWTQTPDAPVDQAAWAAYRQALRDIPTQAGFPQSVTWPTV